MTPVMNRLVVIVEGCIVCIDKSTTIARKDSVCIVTKEYDNNPAGVVRARPEDHYVVELLMPDGVTAFAFRKDTRDV